MASEGRIIGRPFVTGFVVSFLMYFAVGATIPLLPRLVTNGLGGDNADVGRLGAVFALAAVACRPLVAVVSRRGSARTAQVGAVLSVAGCALIWNVANLAVLAVSRVLVAIGEAMVWVAFGTLATAHAPRHRQAEAVSLSSVAIFLAIALGPLSTEVLAKNGDFAQAALIPTGAVVLCALVAFAIRPEWDPPQSDLRRKLSRHELFHPAALIPGAMLGLIMIGWSSWSNYVALRADELGLSNAAILFTIYSGISLTIRLLGARLPERIGLRRCAAASALLVAAALVVLGSATSAPGLYLGAVVMALGVATNFPSLSAIALAELRDPSERASLLSSFGMFFEIGAGIGGLLIGPVARGAGLQTAFRVSAIAPMLALALIGWMATRPMVTRAARLRHGER